MFEALIFSIGLTSHIGFEKDYNEVHPHVRYSNDGVIAGAYYNSEERVSFYGGYRFEPINNFGFELGVVNGYPTNTVVKPYVRGTYDLGNFRAFIAPGLESNKVGAVVGVEITIK